MAKKGLKVKLKLLFGAEAKSDWNIWSEQQRLRVLMDVRLVVDINGLRIFFLICNQSDVIPTSSGEKDLSFFPSFARDFTFFADISAHIWYIFIYSLPLCALVQQAYDQLSGTSHLFCLRHRQLCQSSSIFSRFFVLNLLWVSIALFYLNGTSTVICLRMKLKCLIKSTIWCVGLNWNAGFCVPHMKTSL